MDKSTTNKTKQPRKETLPMKTTSNSRSAFFIPRIVLGFALCSVGVFLTFAAFSQSVTDSLRTNWQPAAHGTTKSTHQSPQLDTDWPQYGFDPQHTSFNPEETLLSTN